MVEIQLKEYQLNCIEKVTSKIKDGEKHFSVAMSVGLGQRMTSLFLADKLNDNAHIPIAMVFRLRGALLQTREEAEKLGLGSIEFLSVNEFIKSDNDYKYIIFNDLSLGDRKIIQECSNISDCITVSFFTIGQEVSREQTISEPSETSQRLLAYFEKLTPVVCTYCTNKVLDIRDAKYAGECERTYAYEKNIDTINWINQERINILNEREEIKKREKYLNSYLTTFTRKANPQKDEELEEEKRLKNILLQEDVRDKEFEELRAREKEYQELLKEKDAMIEQRDAMIAFHQEIFSAIGIDDKTILDSFERIQKIRFQLKNDLESCDVEKKEKALKKLQDKTAEIVSSLIIPQLTKKEYKRFEEDLINDFTKDIWDRLEEKSKVFLITAKSTFKTMNDSEDREKYDYSGVCLLVTKALEVETTKRFFSYFKEYLEKKYNSVSKWPHAMRQREKGRVIEKAMDESEFTLGSVIYVIGLKCEYDSKGNIINYPISYKPAQEEFLMFAKKNLYIFSEQNKVEMEIEKDYQFIEKVRLDYRNPSAHKSRLTITSAKECLDYVLDAQHMLRDMLINMKI